MPGGTSPNISGSVNYDGSKAVPFLGTQEVPSAPATTGSTPSILPANTNHYLLPVMIGIIVMVAVFLFWRWLKKKLF